MLPQRVECWSQARACRCWKSVLCECQRVVAAMCMQAGRTVFWPHFEPSHRWVPGQNTPTGAWLPRRRLPRGACLHGMVPSTAWVAPAVAPPAARCRRCRWAGEGLGCGWWKRGAGHCIDMHAFTLLSHPAGCRCCCQGTRLSRALCSWSWGGRCGASARAGTRLAGHTWRLGSGRMEPGWQVGLQPRGGTESRTGV